MSGQTIQELNQEINGEALAAIAVDHKRMVAEENRCLQDEIAAHLQTRLQTLYTFGRHLESGFTEWCVRDMTKPDFEGNDVGQPPSGGIVKSGFTSEEADKLRAHILAGEVMEIINQGAAP